MSAIEGPTVRLVSVSRAQLADWFAIACDAKIVVARGGTVALASKLAAELLERDDLEGLAVGELIPPGARAWHAAKVEAYFRSLVPQPMGRVGLVIGVTGSGRRVPLDLSIAPISLDGDHAALVTLRDVSRERAMTAALADSHARLRAIVEAIPDTIVCADREGNVELVNHLAPSLTDSDVMGRGWESSLAPEDRPRAREAVARAVSGTDTVTLEMKTVRPDATWDVQMRRVVRDGEVTGLVVVSRDVTLQKREEAQRAAARQLASLGMISAALAHEINNPLAAVTWNVESALATLSADEAKPAARDALTEAHAALTAMRDIVRDLRIFGREERNAVQRVDVLAVFDATLRLARNELRHHARVVLDLQPVPRVRASEAYLGQIFLNLLINAAHAIPQGESDRNRIVVRTRTEPDGRARIDIEDSGVGMTADVRERLFTPFFTTKPLGAGSGLGLSICQRMVVEIDGEIRVETSPGVGSTFTVLLPAASSEPGMAASVATPARTRRTVLFVDDDEGVVRALQRALRDHHDLAGATSAKEAIASIEAREPDVIVCDVMMPDALGTELIHRILERWPSLASRVIFLTGGAWGAGAREIMSGRLGRVLQKPIAIADLLRAIDSIEIG